MQDCRLADAAFDELHDGVAHVGLVEHCGHDAVGTGHTGNTCERARSNGWIFRCTVGKNTKMESSSCSSKLNDRLTCELL